MGPPLNDIPRSLALLDGAGALAPGDLAMLHAAYDQLGPLLREPAGPLQPLHGDAHPGNLLATTNGLLWIDWEDTCVGPIAWDLACLSMAGADALSAYPDAPDPIVLQRYRDARLLQITTWAAVLPPVFPGHERIIESLLEHWRASHR